MAHGHRMTLSVTCRACRTLPGLGNFFTLGQWVWPGGPLNIVAMAGRNLVKRLCQQDRKRFAATLVSHPTARILPDFSDGSPSSAQRTKEDSSPPTSKPDTCPSRGST